MTSHPLPLEGIDTVVLDVDGTLLDSNYHHVVAWGRALASLGLTVPLWRIHRHIGMGGDRLVPAVVGEEADERHGDEARDRWKKEYDELIDETRLFAGAQDLLGELRGRGLTVALASSSEPEHAAHALELLDADRLSDAATTSEDAEESKPDPELLDEVIERVEGRTPVMVGDSPWDVEAATRAGWPTVGLLAGGYGREELLESGAAAVYDDVRDLLDHLDDLLGTADAATR